jgi:hypothetical protein
MESPIVMPKMPLYVGVWINGTSWVQRSSLPLVRCMIDDFQLRVHCLTFHLCSTDSFLSLTLAKGSPSFTILSGVVFHSKVLIHQ